MEKYASSMEKQFNLVLQSAENNDAGRYRLYRAQRLYVQLLSKSMLIAILIGNGIRLQSTIALCPEKGFFMSYYTRHKGGMSISKKISEHKGCTCMSILGKSSEHKGCMSTFML